MVAFLVRTLFLAYRQLSSHCDLTCWGKEEDSGVFLFLFKKKIIYLSDCMKS